MRNIVLVTSALAALNIILLLMLFATQIGGIAIRNDFSGRNFLIITLSEPAIRGVPVAIRWTAPADEPERELRVVFRDTSGEHVLGITQLKTESARVTLPCVTTDTEGSLLLIDSAREQIIGQTPVTLLPPTAECAIH
jgi:hypothetical protein